MAQQTLNDGVSFGEQRSKINSNFTELYSTKTNMSDITTAVSAHAGAADPHGVTYPITPGGCAVDITGSDLNSLYRTGFCRGYGLVHAPLDNGGWWYVLIASGDAYWVKQTATSFGSANTAGEIYERVRVNSVWTSWAKVYKGADVYPVAASLGSGASINGKVFSGLENIRVAESIHSERDCRLGTLIETSIDYTGFNGDPFLLRITGNSYYRYIPVDISVQGYIYDFSLVQYGGISTGSVISGLVALLHNGHLSFWFPYQGYFEGYDVSVITAFPDQNVNKVISIQNAAMPADAERVVELSSSIRQAITRGEAIDSAAIGQTTPAAGAFTTLSASGLSVAGDISSTGKLTTAGIIEDASGNLLVGTGSGSCHIIVKNTPADAGNQVVVTGGFNGISFAAYSISGGLGNAANAAVKVGMDGTTNRSINAEGTINASGADYAEYERNNGLTFAKGDIVGFRADGTLTDKWSGAIRFGIKSTNPSYVGGDVWGTEAQVGKRPEQPIYTAPAYTGPQQPVEPTAPTATDEEEVNTEANGAEYLESLNAYQDALTEYNAAQADYKFAVAEAEDVHAEAMTQYEADKAAFESRLEAARQTVDRIAYSGKVPCNVTGATPGGYIVAAASEDGLIVGEFIPDPDFSQYKRAIGRVNRILDDGRCEIAVIVH